MRPLLISALLNYVLNNFMFLVGCSKFGSSSSHISVSILDRHCVDAVVVDVEILVRIAIVSFNLIDGAEVDLVRFESKPEMGYSRSRSAEFVDRR